MFTAKKNKRKSHQHHVTSFSNLFPLKISSWNETAQHQVFVCQLIVSRFIGSLLSWHVTRECMYSYISPVSSRKAITHIFVFENLFLSDYFNVCMYFRKIYPNYSKIIFFICDQYSELVSSCNALYRKWENR